MPTTRLDGVNFTFFGDKDDSIMLFGIYGCKFVGKGTWGIGDVETDPSSIVGLIRDCINSDVKSGNRDKVAMILLSPRPAVIFYLEDRLTRAHFANSTESLDFIELPNVEFDGRNLTVRILRKFENNVATADSEGNVL